MAEPEGKLEAKEADYTKDGPLPFVCQTCSHFASDESCELVEGPYEDGLVAPEDTCRLWEAGTKVAGRGANEVFAYQNQED